MKNNASNTEKNEIIRLLEKMQEGYTNRAVEKLEDYTKELFIQSDDMVILGTSDGEWCLGYEQSKKLVENDWKYWGNVLIDTEKVEITVDGNVAWFNTLGSVEQNFKTTEKTYDAFVENVKEYLTEEKCWLGEVSDETKLTTIAWELTHLLTGEGKKYNWQIRLSGVAVKGDNGWKFVQMQFSLPTTSRYPDERIWENGCYEFSHAKGYEKLKGYMESRKKAVSSELKSTLDKFNNEFLNKELATDQIVDKYFSKDEKVCLVGTDTDKYTGYNELVSGIGDYRLSWDELNIGIEEAIIHEHEEVAWIVTQGEAKAVITYQDAIKLEMERAKEIMDSGLTSKEKLDRINKNILTMLNEASKGEENLWPIRFEAVLVKEEGKWLFHYMQLSYPSNIILEGKTEAAVMIE